MGAIAALEALEGDCVHLHKAIPSGVCKGVSGVAAGMAAARLEDRGRKPVLNRDLWERLWYRLPAMGPLAVGAKATVGVVLNERVTNWRGAVWMDGAQGKPGARTRRRMRRVALDAGPPAWMALPVTASLEIRLH